MSIKGFSVDGVVQRYDYTALDNLPQGQGVSEDLKAALLQLAKKVAYIDDQGQTYYDDLYNALYPEKTLLSIMANFQQGQAVIYNTDSLDTLKQYLTVTAVYDDTSTATVASSAYTLSGSLTVGTSVITVTYEGKTDAFNVSVTAAPMSFAVTNNLTGCTTSNSATAVLEGNSYTAVITASSGYTLVGATVSITMGGQDITTSAYSGGIISINNVTGVLVIAVSAVERVLSSITAVYTQSGTVYETDTLDSLKADLVVTAVYSDSSTATVAAADYTLSGTLTEGTSTITVSYDSKTTTFQVVVTHRAVPVGFTAVDFISSAVHGTPAKSHLTTTPYIKTDFPGADVDIFNYTVEMVFKPLFSGVNCCPFGGRDGKTAGGTTRGTVLTYDVVNASSLVFGNKAGQTATTVTYFGNPFSAGAKVKIVVAEGKIYIDDTQVATIDATTAEQLSAYKWAIFGRNNKGSFVANTTNGGDLAPMIGNIYAFSIKDGNGDYVLNFIPCVRDSDSVYGMYDTVSGNFYTSAISTAFSGGND